MSDPILRTGKIFEAGHYPEKNFSLSAEEMAQAVAGFEPVPVDLEHVPTVLSGKLGTVEKLEARGEELFGTVAVPEWLNTLLGSDPLQVSCTWDRATKRLAGLALVRTPRIADAALMSAFAAFAGKRHSAEDEQALQQIHDLTVGQGAACKAEMSGAKHMTAWERLKAFLTKSGADPQLADDLQAEFSKPPPAPAEDPRVKQLEERLAASEKAARLAQFGADARGFLYSMRGRIYPIEATILQALFTQLAEDDAAAKATVTFAVAGEAKTGSRLETLQALIAARPEHGRLGDERLVGGLPEGAMFLDTGRTGETAELDKLGESMKAYASRNGGRGGK
jgi:hypothetical protein